MKVITVGGEKGGPGKSTLATNFAVQFAHQGFKVLLINTDKQDTSGKWALVRENNHPELPTIHTQTHLGNRVAKGILDQSAHYDKIVVDARGNDSVEQRQAISVSDGLLIPMRAAAFDTWTLDDVDEVVAGARAINEDLCVGVFMNQILHVSLDGARKAMSALMAEYPNIPFLKAAMTSLVAYQKAGGEGMGIVEFPRAGKAKSHFLMVFEEFMSLTDGKEEEAA